MVTLNNADNVLKSFYLDAVSDALNMKINPFLAKIEKSSANVSGKDVRKAISCGFNNGIGAGTETGDLPMANGNEYKQFVTTLKNFYGTLEISDKAIRAAASNDGAFVNLLNEEMRTLINTAKFNFGRMLFGDGSGTLATVQEYVNSTDIRVDNAQNFVEGMLVDFVSGNMRCSEIKILHVDYENGCISVADADNLSKLENAKIVIYGTDGEELTGLAAIFGEGSLYGVDRETFGMKPYIVKDADMVTQDIIQEVLDIVEMKSGSKPNMIICSSKVRRELVTHFRDYNMKLPTIDLGDGIKALDFYGVPVVVDRFCPVDKMYLLNTDYFKLHQLCDWQWLESEDGKILKQSPGRPVYTATLVKYAELLCENPSAQGMICFSYLSE